jgi:phosphate transport system protein
MSQPINGPLSRQHTSKQFEAELESIRSHLLELGGVAEEQLRLSMAALVNNDLELAREVIRGDKKVNDLDIAINDQCTEVLARRQPAGIDLRLLVAVLKTVTDLERIGDDAKRIARLALAMGEHYPRKSQLNRLQDFSVRVRERLRDTLDAFSRIDVQAAFAVKQKDDELDEEYRDIMREHISAMSGEPRTIPVALNLIWIAKALERVGDRACNICEYVIYYALGKDVRHLTLEQTAQDLAKE